MGAVTKNGTGGGGRKGFLKMKMQKFKIEMFKGIDIAIYSSRNK